MRYDVRQGTWERSSSSGSDKPNRNHRCTIVRKKKTYQNPTLRHTSLAIKIFVISVSSPNLGDF